MPGVGTISMEETVRFGRLADLKLNVRRFALYECYYSIRKWSHFDNIDADID